MTRVLNTPIFMVSFVYFIVDGVFSYFGSLTAKSTTPSPMTVKNGHYDR
jgi:hypothetical protein